MLSGLDADIKSCDVIGVLLGRKKAHYLVVWISNDSAGDKMLVAFHRLEFEECPWLNLLTETDQPQTQQNSGSIHT